MFIASKQLIRNTDNTWLKIDLPGCCLFFFVYFLRFPVYFPLSFTHTFIMEKLSTNFILVFFYFVRRYSLREKASHISTQKYRDESKNDVLFIFFLRLWDFKHFELNFFFLYFGRSLDENDWLTIIQMNLKIYGENSSQSDKNYFNCLWKSKQKKFSSLEILW